MESIKKEKVDILKDFEVTCVNTKNEKVFIKFKGKGKKGKKPTEKTSL